MKFSGRKLVVTGIVLGTILSFLFSQPTVLNGFVSLMKYLYSFLPNPMARFLQGQTFLTLAFFWTLMLFGVIMWIVRGDFYRAENHSRRDQFTIVNGDRDKDEEDKR